MWSLKIPRQCLLVVLVKIAWTEGKALGIEEGKVIGSGLFSRYAALERSWPYSLWDQIGIVYVTIMKAFSINMTIIVDTVLCINLFF
jgi:hypothetical protein